MKRNEEQDIKELLKKMPDIGSITDKDEMFNDITRKLPRKGLSKRNRFAPFLIAALLMLLFIPLPFLLNNGLDSKEGIEHADKQEEVLIMTEESEDAVEQNRAARDNAATEKKDEGKVITSIPPNRKPVHFAILNEGDIYLIPLTLLIPLDEKVEDYYARADEILHSVGFSSDENPIDTVRIDNNEAVVKVGEDFEHLSEAMMHLLLYEMFIPLGWTEVLLEERNREEVMKLELPRNREYKKSYLSYRGEFLAIVPEDMDSTIHDAFHTLQNIDHATLLPTIDSEVDFSLKETEDVLTIEFAEGTIEERVTEVMVESILMTAKSYGYSEVRFENLPDDQVGKYNLNQLVPVPYGANPIVVE